MKTSKNELVKNDGKILEETESREYQSALKMSMEKLRLWDDSNG